MPVKSFEPWVEAHIYEPIDLDEDMEWNYQLLDLPTSEFLTSASDNDMMTQIIDQQTQLPKYTIRNHDCMWSGRCVAHQEKSKCQTAAVAIGHTSNIGINKINTTTIIPQQQQPQQQTTINVKQPHIQQIPAGRSLLLNSRPYQPKSTINKLPTITTTDFLKDREIIARPDTPISLDDDPPEFKHTIDLAACTMGSNQISLINNSDEDTSVKIINLLKEHLEDTSTDNSHVKNDLRPFLTTHKSESLSDLLNEMKYLSDFEELEDDDDSNVEMDSDSESGSSHMSSSELNTKIMQYQATHVADHSYTRPKNRVDIHALGVQTPSDSEEEIDVVSVGDKTLPTNPTARDRRALQTTVADKITARMVTTARGIKTLPPRRRCSEESSSNSCNSTPSKSTNVSNNLSTNYSIQCIDRDTITNSRKRSQTTHKEPNPKRHRGKKQRSSPSSASSSSGKRQNSDSDEADTIEKRNLHNDMERQRRIGLKNLFEELKRQIPSIRDKERAPKVSILREAATLCSKLNRDQDQLAALKKQQHRLLQRVKTLRMTMAPKWG